MLGNYLKFDLEDISAFVADKLNISKAQVKEVIASVFNSVNKTISSAEHDNLDSFKSIRIIYFGLFRINKAFFRSLAKHKKIDLTKINKINDD